MPQADLSRRTEARAERSADPLVAAATIGAAATIRTEMAAIRQRLRDFGAEQANLKGVLAALEVQLPGFEEIKHRSPVEDAAVNNSSPATAKVDLFRNLFKGRADVFPARRENRKTGKAGYSPACANEWVQSS